MDAKLWTDMFVMSVPLVEKIIRPVVVYFVLILGLRLSGKRELAQLNPFDLVVLLTLSNTVQNAIIGDDNTVTGGVIGAATLLLINYLVNRFVYRHPSMERVVEGTATVLMHDGKLLRNHLAKEVLTTEELQVAARRQGFSSLKDVDKAVLEPSGIITFIGKHPDSEEKRHTELLQRIDALSQQLAALRTAAPPTTP